jgi:uncharacterized membrane protein
VRLPAPGVPAVPVPPAGIEPPVNTPVDDEVELILAVFPAEYMAAEMLDSFKTSAAGSPYSFLNAAVIAKDLHGRTAVKEDQDVSAGRGTVFGAFVGGLVGLLAGPGGAVVGAVAGAAAGGFLAARIDLGFEDAFLDELKSALQPGKSALLLLIEEQYGDTLTKTLEAHSEKIFRRAVRKDIVDRLTSQQGE